MTDKQLAILFENMAMALHHAIGRLIAERPDLTEEVAKTPLEIAVGKALETGSAETRRKPVAGVMRLYDLCEQWNRQADWLGSDKADGG